MKTNPDLKIIKAKLIRREVAPGVMEIRDEIPTGKEYDCVAGSEAWGIVINRTSGKAMAVAIILTREIDNRFAPMAIEMLDFQDYEPVIPPRPAMIDFEVDQALEEIEKVKAAENTPVDLKCECCGFEQHFDNAEEAFKAGWDAPPHFTQVVCCNLCPAVCKVVGLSHEKAHAFWAEHGRPQEFNELCVTDKEFPTIAEA